MLHKESDEAQRQLARQEGAGESSEEESGGEGSEEGDGGKEAGKEDADHAGTGEKRLRNQFNFSERASQTLNNPYRVSCMVQEYW